MGFLENMANEAGKKTGKAIGNKLFGKYADDIRIGVSSTDDDGGNSARTEVKKVKAEGKERRKELKLQEKFNTKNNIRQQINEIQSLTFDTESVKGNINVMMQLASIIESTDTVLDSSWDEDQNDLQEQLQESALSKFNMGIELCKAIDPTDPSIVMFENIIKKRKQKEEEEKQEDKKSGKLALWLIIGSVLLIILAAVMASIFQ